MFSGYAMGWKEIPIKFACEFKRPGTVPHFSKKHGILMISTDLQYKEQQAMRESGWTVFESCDFEEFKITVRAYEESCL